jgi:hypothetical protein
VARALLTALAASDAQARKGAQGIKRNASKVEVRGGLDRGTIVEVIACTVIFGLNEKVGPCGKHKKNPTETET